MKRNIVKQMLLVMALSTGINAAHTAALAGMDDATKQDFLNVNQTGKKGKGKNAFIQGAKIGSSSALPSAYANAVQSSLNNSPFASSSSGSSSADLSTANGSFASSTASDHSAVAPVAPVTVQPSSGTPQTASEHQPAANVFDDDPLGLFGSEEPKHAPQWEAATSGAPSNMPPAPASTPVSGTAAGTNAQHQDIDLDDLLGTPPSNPPAPASTPVSGAAVANAQHQPIDLDELDRYLDSLPSTPTAHNQAGSAVSVTPASSTATNAQSAPSSAQPHNGIDPDDLDAFMPPAPASTPVSGTAAGANVQQHQPIDLDELDSYLDSLPSTPAAHNQAGSAVSVTPVSTTATNVTVPDVNNQAAAVISEINEHKAEMADHTAKMEDHAEAMVNHVAAMDEHTEKMEDHKAEMADHTQQMADHSQQMAAHSQQIENHGQQLAEHSALLQQASVVPAPLAADVAPTSVPAEEHHEEVAQPQPQQQVVDQTVVAPAPTPAPVAGDVAQPQQQVVDQTVVAPAPTPAPVAGDVAQPQPQQQVVDQTVVAPAPTPVPVAADVDAQAQVVDQTVVAPAPTSAPVAGDVAQPQPQPVVDSSVGGAPAPVSDVAPTSVPVEEQPVYGPMTAEQAGVTQSSQQAEEVAPAEVSQLPLELLEKVEQLSRRSITLQESFKRRASNDMLRAEIDSATAKHDMEIAESEEGKLNATVSSVKAEQAIHMAEKQKVFAEKIAEVTTRLTKMLKMSQEDCEAELSTISTELQTLEDEMEHLGLGSSAAEITPSNAEPEVGTVDASAQPENQTGSDDNSLPPAPSDENNNGIMELPFADGDFN